jgi:zinc protease
MAGICRSAVVGSIQRLFEQGTVISLGERQLLDRFLSCADESAFEAIVGRHGPMVLSVCRHVLADEHDVEDAFQATFLILVKKAGSIRDRDVLGTWLYGVARRVAVRAQANARRRQAQERTGLEQIDVRDDHKSPLESNEIRAIVDAELERLPQRYRAPLILCEIEGRTHEQAAVEIGCPVGTIKSRLSRGRERLRSRLARRGLATSVLVPGPMFLSDPAWTVPAKLLGQTVRAATQLVTKEIVQGGALTVGAATLAHGVIHAMAMTKLRIAMVALLAAGLAGIAVGSALGRLAPMSRPQGREAASLDRLGAADPESETPVVGDEVAAGQIPVEPGSERFVLDNGLTVILRPVQSKSISLNVLYSIGSDHDPAGHSGLTHMLEHLYVTAAAGGEKSRTAEEFVRRYAMGANAQTGHRYTIFAAVFPTNELDAELKDAAARMGDLRITQADLDRERPRILEEVDNMFGAMPMLAALNNARDLIRPTPSGGRDGGSPEHLRALTLEEVRGYWQHFYKPDNAILALAGDIDSKAVREAIKINFAKIAGGLKPPPPLEPQKSKAGTRRELTVDALEPDAASIACLAYSAPQPGSDLYAPFLILVSRLWAAASNIGNDGPTGSPIYFTPLDDGSVVAVSTEAKPGETSAQTFARIEAIVAETIGPKLRPSEIAATRQEFAPFLLSQRLPDNVLANNIYGVAFSLGRRQQLGIDPRKLDKALGAVTEADIRRAAMEIFVPSRHAGAFVSVKKKTQTPESAKANNDEQARRPMASKRGALQIARIKHAGDWDIAPKAIPNLMEAITRPPFSFDVVIKQKELDPLDPSLVYYPILHLHGRAAFSLDEKELGALRVNLDPGGGTIFADAGLGNAAFDASFRRMAKSLFPDKPLVPIPHDDELFSTKVGADLSKVKLNKAAGGAVGFPQLEGVRIGSHWAIIYSKYDIGGALDGNANIEAKGYTPESATKIAVNIVIYATLP